MDKQTFKEKLKEKGIDLNEYQIKQFDAYFKLLEEYNKVMDLTAVIAEDEVYERHFYNSLTIAFNHDFNNLALADIGAGAGFPSIPLKIAFPEMKLTIIDPLRKRMDFLKIVIKELGLKDVNILYQRAEDASKEKKEQFDIVTARAVAKLNILVEIVSQLVKVDGTFIAMKGEKGEQELKEATKAIKECGFKLDAKVEIAPSINYYFKKENKTPLKYPRNYGQIVKKPL